MTETEWLKKPKFSEDGKSYTLVNWKEVPKGSIVTIGLVTFDELKAMYWNNNG